MKVTVQLRLKCPKLFYHLLVLFGVGFVLWRCLDKQSVNLYLSKNESNNKVIENINNKTLDHQSSASVIPKCPVYGYTKGKWVKDLGDSDYRWQVTNDDCQLDKWDVKSFCRILNGRSILIVGDSVNGNLYHSILTAFGVEHNGDTVEQVQEIIEGRRVPVHRTLPICDNNKSIMSFIRNDWLTLGTTLGAAITQHNIFTPWLHLLRYHEIVILNKGAHARPIQKFRNSFGKLVTYLHKNYNGTVIFRTTPRGHINCSTSDVKPIAEVDDSEWNRFFKLPKRGNDAANKYKLYSYGLFPSFNEIMMKKVVSPHILIDIAPILELRPDVHNPPKDCLHVNRNKESVLDIWLQLLLNSLQGSLQ